MKKGAARAPVNLKSVLKIKQQLQPWDPARLWRTGPRSK